MNAQRRVHDLETNRRCQTYPALLKAAADPAAPVSTAIATTTNGGARTSISPRPRMTTPEWASVVWLVWSCLPFNSVAHCRCPVDYCQALLKRV